MFIATFSVLAAAGFLLATVGGARTRRRSSLAERQREALPAALGASLGDLLEQTRRLRIRLAATRQDGRQLLEVELAVGDHGRRPLWRQLEDVHHGDALEAARVEVRNWVACFDLLEGADRQLMLELGLEPVVLREPTELGFGQPGPASVRARRLEALRSTQHWLDSAIAELDRFDTQLSGYRPRLYR